MKMENVGKLISEKAWKDEIESLRCEPTITDNKSATSLVAKSLVSAVERSIPKQGKIGVLLSGGVDSSLLAFLLKRVGVKFTCYSVGLSEAKDLTSAIIVAEELGLDIKTNVLTLDEAEKIIRETVSVLGDKTGVVNIGVGAVEVAGIKLAKTDGVSFLYSGLGSEEIFAGYQRHELSSDVNEECWVGLCAMWDRDLVRDWKISESLGVKFITPFLDSKMIKDAMQISPELKIVDGVKKYILRMAAMNLGLPERFALRPKKAAQYGSKIDKALGKLAKKSGFKYKKDYLEMLLKDEKHNDDNQQETEKD